MSNEAISALINGYYTDLLAILPATLLLAGLLYTVAIDPYIRKERKRIIKAEQTGEAPLLVKYLNKPELGLPGIIVNMPKDEGSVQDLMDELEKLRQS